MHTIVKIYIGLTLVMLADLVVFYVKGISFAGNLFDRALFWVWLCATCYVVVCNFLRRWARFYGLFLVVLFVLSLFPMGIPLVTLAAFAMESEKRLEVDDIRLFETVKSPLAIPYVSVTKNHLLFEQEVGQLNYIFDIDGRSYRLAEVRSVNKSLSKEEHGIELEFVFDTGTVVAKVLHVK